MLNWVRRPQRPFVMPIFISLPAINLAWNPVIKTQRHGSAIMKPVKPINQQRRVWLTSAAISGFGLTITPETAFMKWDITFCKYSIDIDPRANSRLETMWADNWLKDAQGDTVARFFSGFGATWGAGSSDMGGTNPKGSRLPKTIHLSYYDYQEDRFYRL